MSFASQAMMLPEGKWNAVNEPSPGSLVAPAVQPRWSGLIGRCWYADDIAAAQCSDTSVGTLRAGWYAMVQVLLTATQAPARGHACFWLTAANMASYIATSDGGATLDGRMVGVFISAPTKGNYCIIQLGGICTVQYAASVDATDGDLVSIVTTSFTFDSFADSGTVNAAGGTAPSIKTIKGVALEAPANSALKLAYITPNFWNFKLA